jgi:ferredoxin
MAANPTTGSADSPERSNLEPELGGVLRSQTERSGFEPELGGALRQRGVYVDEVTCIGCKYCAHVAGNTFYIEPNHGRSRVVRQDGDPVELIEEAMDTCPVNCIHWVEYQELKALEAERQYQVIPIAGLPVNHGALTAKRRRTKKSQAKKSQAKKSQAKRS